MNYLSPSILKPKTIVLLDCIVRFSSFVDLFGNFHLADRWKLCIELISNRNHDQLRQYPTSVKAYS